VRALLGDEDDDEEEEEEEEEEGEGAGERGLRRPRLSRRCSWGRVG
jgi:hypothetical protein